MLIQLPDVLVADEVRHARQLLATASWTDGRPGAGSQAIQVKNNEQAILNEEGPESEVDGDEGLQEALKLPGAGKGTAG